ncbi:MAG: hypothetical protein SFU86_24345 [Pirellulaceae bacterium]|nr:hypothetical protein [Pirellulaceae bacterium]
MQCRLFATAGCCLAMLLAVAIGAAEPEPPREDAPPPAAEREFLARFVGDWLGAGTSEGKPVKDVFRCQWSLGERFVRFSYQAEAGDKYVGEGYFWFNPRRERYEWWEFNNGHWPVRQHVGRREGDALLLEESAADRKLRLVFRFTPEGTLQMTEGFVEGERVKPYVTITFRRQPAR